MDKKIGLTSVLKMKKTNNKLSEIIKKYNENDFFSFEENKQKLYINFAFHSNAIEGNTLTLEETENIFTINRFSEKKSVQDNLEIFDYKSALNFIIEQANKKVIIDETFIKILNSEILKNTGSIVKTALGMVDASKGEYRLSSVFAGNTIFPDAKKIKSLMSIFFENYKNIQDFNISEAVNKAADIHFDFVSIHPFYDGNGRTARLLMNYIMYINNLPFIILKKESKTEYFSAIKRTRATKNINIFRDFIKEQYYNQLEQEIKSIKKQENSKNIFLSF